MSTDPLLFAPDASSAWQDRLILDARLPEAHAAGHIPGAVQVSAADWDRAAKSADSGLENAAYWAGIIGALGIGSTTRVAVHDDGRLTDATRIWFFLQHFGVDVRVIDGGWPLIAPHLPGIATGGPVQPEPVEFTPGPARFATLFDRKRLADALGDGIQLWDVRTPAEFSGEDARQNARPGHLPGAILLNHVDLTGSDGRLLPPADLGTLLARAGFGPEKPVIAYCEGGGRAALAAFAALVAGYREAGAYYLSFADWSRHPDLPVER